MKVRPMESGDRDTFLRLCKDFYCSGATNRGYNHEIACSTFDYLMRKHENLWGYLIEDCETGAAVGYALLTSYWCNEDGGNVVILDELYIDPCDRHKGYGRHLLQWAEDTFRDKAVAITLEVVKTNAVAKEMYTRAGFEDDGFEIMTQRLDAHHCYEED